MTVTQRLFGVKCAGSFAQATNFVTAPDGTVNIIATDLIYFVNGVNNVAINGPVEVDYTLYSVGTAGSVAPPPVIGSNIGWYLQFP